MNSSLPSRHRGGLVFERFQNHLKYNITSQNLSTGVVPILTACIVFFSPHTLPPKKDEKALKRGLKCECFTQ